MVTKAAEAAEVSVRCPRKWVARYLAAGDLGLLVRSSAPNRIPRRRDEERVAAIAALRRLRFGMRRDRAGAARAAPASRAATAHIHSCFTAYAGRRAGG